MCKKRMALEGESRQRHHYHYHQLNHHQQQQQHQSDNGSSSQSAMSSPRSSSSSSANTHSRGLPLLLPTDHHQADHVFSSPSSPEEEEAGPLQMGEGGRMALLQDKMKRTTKMLKEIQALTAACEEMPPHGDVKEKQVFVRRILQVSTELQDARDVLQDLCRPPTLTPRQFELVFSSNGSGSEEDGDGDGGDGDGSDPLSGDPYLDPSVRFFGLDWQQLFGRCLSLSLNLRILGQQVSTPGVEVDLMLLSGIRRDLARVEVDVASHGEAVMHGRLSKSQQMLILREQSRVSSLTPAAPPPKTKVPKSRSFRDSSRHRQAARYRKTRTTDLNKLSAHLDPTAGGAFGGRRSQEEIRGEWREVMDQTRMQEEKAAAASPCPSRKSSSFMQNVSSLFKNIR